jgi:hypothetical protein
MTVADGLLLVVYSGLGWASEANVAVVAYYCGMAEAGRVQQVHARLSALCCNMVLWCNIATHLT